MIASSLSRKIFIALVVLLILSFVRFFGAGGHIVELASLIPVRVIPGWEIWRLFTYPIVPEVFGVLVGLITFSIPGEELEQMLGTRQYGLLMLMMLLCAALMHTVLFFGGEAKMIGPANIAFFVLVGFVYLFPHSEIQIIFIRLRSWVLLTILSGVLLLLTAANAGGLRDLLYVLSSGGFGLILGGAYFHARFQKYPFLLRPIRSMERMTVRLSPTARKTAPAPRRTSTQQPVRVRIPFQKPAAREMTDEERLNAILEKISEKSYSALTEDEKRFLRDYSGKL